MKTRSAICLGFFFLFNISLLLGQSIPFNQTQSDAKLYAWSTSNSSGLISENSQFPVGSHFSGQSRAYYQWSIPDNIIPDGSTILSAKLEFTYSRVTGPNYYHFSFGKVENDITTTSTQTLYDGFTEVFHEGTSSNYSYVAEDQKLTEWISESLADNRFAVVVYLNTEQNYPTYLYQISPVKLTVTVAPQTVNIDQTYEDGSRVQSNGVTSRVGHWESTVFVNYTVPKQFTFNINTVETMRADTSMWSNPQTGNQEKYRIWSISNDVVNHKSIDILPGMTSLSSQFKRTNQATIQSQLVDGGNPGPVQFKDPWLIDSADAKGKLNRGTNSVFRNIDYSTNNIGLENQWYKGVFLNQAYDDPSDPYYSVNAISPTTINGIVSHFLNWTGSNVTFQNSNAHQTGVVFTASGATAIANYKGHRISSSSAALKENSQRKIVKDYAGWYHAVYEASGRIFYIKSSNGVDWSGETLLSYNSNNYRNPSIGVCQGSDQIWYPAVTWEYFEPGYDWFDVEYRKASSGGWESMVSITGYMLEETAVHGKPNIVYPFVVFQYADGLYWSYWNNYTWSAMQKIPNTTADSRNVSVIHGTGQDNLVHIAWEEAGSIYYRNASISGGTLNWSGSELVASGSEMVENTSPSIALDNAGKVTIAWQYFHNELTDGSKINIRKRLGTNSYGSVTAYGQYRKQNLAPSISGSRKSNNNLSVVWHSSTNTIKRVSYSNNAWGAMYDMASNGVDAQIYLDEAHGYSTTKSALYRGTTGTYYPIGAVAFTEPSGLEKLGRNSNIVASRSLVLTSDQGEHRIEIGEPTVYTSETASMIVPFLEVGDTIPVGSLESAMPFFRTEPFLLVKGAAMVLPVDFRASRRSDDSRLSELRCVVDLIETGTGKLLASIPLVQRTDGGNQVITPKFGGDVRVEAQVRVLSGLENARCHIENITSSLDSASIEQLQKEGEKLVVNVKPTTYELSQNYPNPFNPVTTIHYALPKAGTVMLKVYDITGKEVATLVDGYHDIGRYTVPFDGSGLASGLYIYKITSESFTQIKKMMLVK